MPEQLFSDDYYRALGMQQSSAPSSAQVQDGPLFTDDYYKALAAKQNSPNMMPQTAQPQMIGAPKAPQPGQPYNFVQDVLDVFDAIGQRLGRGAQAQANDIKNAQYVYGGRDPNQYRAGEDELPAPKEYVNDFIAKNFDRMLGPAIEALPSVGNTLAGGIAGGATGAATGAVAGTLGGPFAEVTVPGGAVAGAAPGFGVGMFSTSAALATGEMYGELRKTGLTDAQARPAAVAYGLAAGAFTAGGAVGGKLTADALQKFFAQGPIKQLALRMATNAGVNTVAGGIQGMTEWAIRSATLAANGKASLNAQDWKAALRDSFINAARTGIPLGVGLEAGHAVIGKAASYLSKEAPTMEDAQDVLHAAMEHTGISPLEQARQDGQRAQQAAQQTATDVARGRLSPIDISMQAQEAADATYQQQAERLQQATEAHEASIKAEDERNQLVNDAVAAVTTKAGAFDRIKAAEKAKGAPLTDDERNAAAESERLSPDTLRNEQRVKNTLEQVKTSLPWVGEQLTMASSQKGKLRFIFQDHPNSEHLADAFDTQAAESLFGAKHESYVSNSMRTLADAVGGGTKDVIKLMNKAENEVLRIRDFKDAEDSAPRVMTAAEAMQYMAWMKSNKARAGMKARGFTFNDEFTDPNVMTTERAIRGALDTSNPNYMKVVSAIDTVYNQHLYQNLATALKRFNGQDLGREEVYGGRLRYEGQPENTAHPEHTLPRFPGSDSFEPERSAPAFTEERTGASRPIAPVSIFKNLNERMLEQAAFEAYAEPGKMWNALITNEEFRNSIRTKFQSGDALLQSVTNGFKDVVHGVPELKKWNLRLVDNVIRAGAMVQLGAKPLQAVKHLMTTVNFLLYRDAKGYVPASEFIAGLREFINDPEKAIRTVQEIDAVKARYASPEKAAYGAVVSHMAGPKETALVRLLMAPFTVGDWLSVHIGAYPIYRHVLNKTGSIQAAQRAAGNAINEVLASGSLSQLSDLNKSQVGRLMVQFQQPAIRLLQHQTDAIRLAMKFPTPENLAGAVRATALTHIAAAAFVAPELAMKYWWDKDQKKVDSAIEEFYRSLIIGNQYGPWGHLMDFGFAKAYEANTGQKLDVHDYSWAVAQQVDRAKWLYNSLESQFIKHNKATTIESTFGDVINAIQGIPTLAGVGIPVTPIKAIRDMLTKPENPFYIGGLSKSEPQTEEHY